MITRIVSGGQTGADRASLDFALRRGIEHGGWCPRGRRAEDGVLSNAYALKETPETRYGQRTEWNVRDSDGTVVFSLALTLRGGSLLTADLARDLGKPCLHLCKRRDESWAAELLGAFIREHRIDVLNVAGPRESSEPGIGKFVMDVLEEYWNGANA